MGKRLNALLGRESSKTSELRTMANLAIARIALLKNRHTVRCTQERSDVIQMLHLGSHEHERALLRLVIKEQNTLDAFVMIEDYCRLLAERAEMITDSRECPDEVKEMVSSLIFAASRCGGFPELEQIRRMLTTKYGKDFAYTAIQITNNCGVHPKMVEKLSSLGASPEARRDLLKQIAEDNGIALNPIHVKSREQLQMH
ncbi:hypothetical protein C2S51_005980 [Perilla frutescens var. frutescens]|nr:hypothetical protein C2S51_005980 [Perilla frutescens var. frutescens]